MEKQDVKATLESVLNGNDLKQFKAAQKTWVTMPKTALTLLHKMQQVGQALNLLYDAGIEQGLKRDDITVIARQHFDGLNRRERSEYRKLANNYKAIRLYVEFFDIRSANPTYLVNSYFKAVKAAKEDCERIEKAMQDGVAIVEQDVSQDVSQAFGIAVPQTTKTEKVVSEPPAPKKGITNMVTPNTLSPGEVTTQLGYIINQVKTMFNRGKLSADNLTVIEEHLTSCLQHINNVDVNVQLAM